jgi:hypothetical protein
LPPAEPEAVKKSKHSYMIPYFSLALDTEFP